MADSNLKEMMIDDINEEANDANLVADSQQKIKWYLIDTEKSFCKVWNFIISILIIYELFVVPFVLVFPEIYNTIEYKPREGEQGILYKIADEVSDMISGDENQNIESSIDTTNTADSNSEDTSSGGTDEGDATAGENSDASGGGTAGDVGTTDPTDTTGSERRMRRVL